MFDRTGRRSRLDCDFGVTPMVGRHRMDRGTTAGAFTDNDIHTLDIHEYSLLTAMPKRGGKRASPCSFDGPEPAGLPDRVTEHPFMHAFRDTHPWAHGI